MGSTMTATCERCGDDQDLRDQPTEGGTITLCESCLAKFRIHRSMKPECKCTFCYIPNSCDKCGAANYHYMRDGRRLCQTCYSRMYQTPRPPMLPQHPAATMDRFLALRHKVVYDDTPLTIHDADVRTGYRYNDNMTSMLAMITDQWQPDEKIQSSTPWPGDTPPWWYQGSLFAALGVAGLETWLMSWMHWTWLTGTLVPVGGIIATGINLLVWRLNRMNWLRRKQGILRP